MNARYILLAVLFAITVTLFGFTMHGIAQAKGSSRVEAPTLSATQPRLMSVCLWQIPGQYKYLNLYQVGSITVTGEKGNKTVIWGGGRAYSEEIPIPVGAALDVHVNMIQQRLVECEGGSK